MDMALGCHPGCRDSFCHYIASGSLSCNTLFGNVYDDCCFDHIAYVKMKNSFVTLNGLCIS
jgi:hypothetical protein